MIARSISLVKQNPESKYRRFMVVELSDGYGYAEGPKEWFTGLDLEILQSMPLYCHRCKTLIEELTDNICNICISHDS